MFPELHPGSSGEGKGLWKIHCYYQKQERWLNHLKWNPKRNLSGKKRNTYTANLQVLQKVWPAPWSSARRMMMPCFLQLLKMQWQVQPQPPDIRTECAEKLQSKAGKCESVLYLVQLHYLRMATLWVPFMKGRLVCRDWRTTSGRNDQLQKAKLADSFKLPRSGFT